MVCHHPAAVLLSVFSPQSLQATYLVRSVSSYLILLVPETDNISFPCFHVPPTFTHVIAGAGVSLLFRQWDHLGSFLGTNEGLSGGRKE